MTDSGHCRESLITSQAQPHKSTHRWDGLGTVLIGSRRRRRPPARWLARLPLRAPTASEGLAKNLSVGHRHRQGLSVSAATMGRMATNRRTRPASEVLPTASLRLPQLPTGITGVEVRRSARRRSTITARVEADRIVLLLPAHLSARDEQRWVDKMVARLDAKRARPARSDDELARRAELIARKYLNAPAGIPLRPNSVRWVTNMNKRWASCSTDSGEIRVSHRLQEMPDYVLEYVLAHELVHLVEPGHNRRFRQLLAAYPLAERAEGFLQGWAAAQGVSSSESVD